MYSRETLDQIEPINEAVINNSQIKNNKRKKKTSIFLTFFFFHLLYVYLHQNESGRAQKPFVNNKRDLFVIIMALIILFSGHMMTPRIWFFWVPSNIHQIHLDYPFLLPAVTESFCLEVWNRLNTIITVSLEKNKMLEIRTYTIKNRL